MFNANSVKLLRLKIKRWIYFCLNALRDKKSSWIFHLPKTNDFIAFSCLPIASHPPQTSRVKHKNQRKSQSITIAYRDKLLHIGTRGARKALSWRSNKLSITVWWREMAEILWILKKRHAMPLPINKLSKTFCRWRQKQISSFPCKLIHHSSRINIWFLQSINFHLRKLSLSVSGDGAEVVKHKKYLSFWQWKSSWKLQRKKL